MRLELRSFLIDTRSWLKFTARLDPPLVDKGKKRISKLPYRPVINAFALAFLIGIPAFNNYVAIRRPLRLNVIDRFTILSGDERRLVRSFVRNKRTYFHSCDFTYTYNNKYERLLLGNSSSMICQKFPMLKNTFCSEFKRSKVHFVTRVSLRRKYV